MNTRVTLQRPSSSEASGFEDVASVWASMESAPAGVDLLRAGGPIAAGTRKMRLHFRSDVRSDWRVLVDDQTLQVSGYGDPDGQRRELVMVLVEVQ